jgi:hypothetical protein
LFPNPDGMRLNARKCFQLFNGKTHCTYYK